MSISLKHTDNKYIPLLSENVALKKYATQSHTVHTNKADKAVDGNPNPHYTINGPCADTGQRTDPWWRVDLGQIAMVSEVYIVNRDAAGDLLDGFEVRIGRLPSRWKKFNIYFIIGVDQLPYVHYCCTICPLHHITLYITLVIFRSW